MSLVGKNAPVFMAEAVIKGGEFDDQFTLEQFIDNKYVVLFFYPMDFTFVCPTEILAFQKEMEEFEKRDTVVVGCSVDSKFSHLAWLNTPVEKGGINGVKFPLIADYTKTISMNYDVLDGEYIVDEQNNWHFEGNPVALRGIFLIDKKGKIQHILINNLSLGRNIKEVLRMIDVLKHVEAFGEVCPANWEEGKDAMKATSEGVSDYLSKHNL